MVARFNQYTRRAPSLPSTSMELERSDREAKDCTALLARATVPQDRK